MVRDVPDQVTESSDLAQVPEIDGVPQTFACNHCSGCMTDFATIGHAYVWGVSPVGPYHYQKTGGWMERIPDVCPSLHESALSIHSLHNRTM